MNLPKMIAELQAERQRLDEAIVALERLSVSNKSRRGRPPRWLGESVEGQLDGAGPAETAGYAPDSE